jgi:hypothetical protein
MEERTIKEKLKKIQELVQRGEAGEQENAKVLMDRLLKEYGLSLEDLTDTGLVNAVKFPYADDIERRLLMQIYSKVTNSDKIQVVNKGGVLLLLMTRLQEEQMKDMFAIYRKAWQEESNMFFSAFIQKNELFPNALPETDTPEDFESLSKLVNMMRSVNKVATPRQNNLLTKDLF